jgi:hypothetical protein
MNDFCATCLSAPVIALVGQLAEGTGEIVVGLRRTRDLAYTIDQAVKLGLVANVRDDAPNARPVCTLQSLTRMTMIVHIDYNLALTDRGKALWRYVDSCWSSVAMEGREVTRHSQVL